MYIFIFPSIRYFPQLCALYWADGPRKESFIDRNGITPVKDRLDSSRLTGSASAAVNLQVRWPRTVFKILGKEGYHYISRNCTEALLGPKNRNKLGTSIIRRYPTTFTDYYCVGRCDPALFRFER